MTSDVRLLIQDRKFQVVLARFRRGPDSEIAADKTSRKSAESTVPSVLRCHKLCEIGRAGAYFDHL
jgi:hypothetical protein